MRRKQPVIDRFLEKARIPSQYSGCWLWSASTDRKGYGKFKLDGRTRGAHRVAYELAIGPVPDGLELDHLCRTVACVNPLHLEPVSGIENTMRGISVSAINARKTSCAQGHPFNTENTARRPNGHRICRTCARNSKARSRASRGQVKKPRTHCAQGHLFTPDNEYIKPSNGRRQCRKCRTVADRARRARERSKIAKDIET